MSAPVCNSCVCVRNVENKQLCNDKHIYVLLLWVCKDPVNVMQVE